MAEALYERISVKNRRFRSNGGRLTQNFRYKGSPPTNHFSYQKTRLNYLSYAIKIWTDLFSHFVTMHAFVRQTQGQTEFSSLDRVCMSCSAAKTSLGNVLFCVKLCSLTHLLTLCHYWQLDHIHTSSVHVRFKSARVARAKLWPEAKLNLFKAKRRGLRPTFNTVMHLTFIVGRYFSMGNDYVPLVTELKENTLNWLIWNIE